MDSEFRISADDPDVVAIFNAAVDTSLLLSEGLMEQGGPLFLYYVARCLIATTDDRGMRSGMSATLAAKIDRASAVFEELLAKRLATVAAAREQKAAAAGGKVH